LTLALRSVTITSLTLTLWSVTVTSLTLTLALRSVTIASLAYIETEGTCGMQLCEECYEILICKDEEEEEDD
jgi:hypothetical protein